MKRTPLTRRTRIRQRSAKRVAADRAYNLTRKQVLERDEWTCQLALRMDGHHCQGSLHVHHIRLRSQGGSNELSNLLTTCDAGHRWIHGHPREAALFGLIDMRKDPS